MICKIKETEFNVNLTSILLHNLNLPITIKYSCNFKNVWRHSEQHRQYMCNVILGRLRLNIFAERTQ